MAARRLSGVLGILLGAALLVVGVWWLLDAGDAGVEQDLSASESWAASAEPDGPELAAKGRTAERPAKGVAATGGGGLARAAQPGARAESQRVMAPAPKPRAGHVVGVVTDAQGKPIAGAVVTLTEQVPKSQPANRAIPATLRTDAQGQFAHEAAGKGFYTVRVAAKGYIARNANGLSGAAAVRVELPVAMTLSGVLLEKGTETPIANLALFARAVKAGRVGGTSVSASTDEDGRFTFQVPSGEPHFIQYPSGGYAHWGVSGEWIHARFGPFAEEELELTVELERGLVIAGIVRDASGEPLTERFRIEVLGHTARGDPDYDRRRFTNTDAQGAFKATGLPAGRYLVSVKSAFGATGSELTTQAVDGVAAGTEDLVIELRRGEPMVGEIVDDAGQPVTVRGYIHIYPQGSSASSPDSIHATLDGKGGFTSAPLDVSTAYDLLVNGFEGFTQTRVEGVRPGASAVRVTLERAGLIKGKVVRADGGQVPVGLSVLATAVGVAPGTKGAYGFAYTKPDGAFTLNGLGAFTFRLAAGGAESGFIAAGTVTGVSAGATDVELKVKRGVALNGTLLDAHGDPVKTHLLSAVSLDGSGSPSAWTSIPGNDGVFHFAGVQPGKLRILAYVGGTQVTVGEVTAPAKDVKLQLPKP